MSENYRVISADTRLVKWDGDGPIPEDAATNPEKYPEVSEVLKLSGPFAPDGSKPQVIYTRKP